MVAFWLKMLQLARPYWKRLVLGIVMGLLAGLMEPMMLLCVKLIVDVAFGGSVADPMVARDNIKDLPGLIAQIRAQADPVSKFVWERFETNTRARLTAFSTNEPAPADRAATKAARAEVAIVLASELTLIVEPPAIYDSNRFAGVTLSKRTVREMDEFKGTNVSRVNRLLLEDTYPQLTRHLEPFGKYKWVSKQIPGLNDWITDASGAPRTRIVVCMILLVPVVILIRGVVGYLNVYCLQWVAIRSITDLRVKVFAHLLNMPMAYLNKISTGELIQRISGDTSALMNLIGNSLMIIVKDPATLIGLMILLVYNQPWLTLISFAVFPLCFIPIAIYNRRVKQSAAEIQTRSADWAKVMHEAFTGSRIIKAYNLEENVVKRYRELSMYYNGLYMRFIRATEIQGPLMELLGALSVTAVFYLILFRQSQRMEPGELFLFIGGIWSMYRPAKTLLRLYSHLEAARSGSARIFQMLATETTLPEPANPKPLHAKGAEIVFDHITFNYDKKPVLHDFTLTVKPGTMVALVGKTGSGKTTITNLLLRFYDPQQGAVKIGGTDLRDFSTRDLRNQIAVVTQDTILFDDTIRHNIELGRPGATKAEIEAAAEHAHAMEFIQEKPNKFETMVGEKGVLLSGGQKQRLAIARAIVKNAPILILDEATSSLDTQSERAVQNALDELMEGRTTICIAHRLSTIYRADVIVVMDHGRIVEMGKHDDLIKQGGIYQKLHELAFDEKA